MAKIPEAESFLEENCTARRRWEESHMPVQILPLDLIPENQGSAPSRDNLVVGEGQERDVEPRSDLFTCDTASDGLGKIVDQDNTLPSRKIEERISLDGLPEKSDDHDCPSSFPHMPPGP